MKVCVIFPEVFCCDFCNIDLPDRRITFYAWKMEKNRCASDIVK